MTQKTIATALALLLGTAASWAIADSVFTWKDGGQSVYSDTPRKLSTQNVSTMNVRSHTVTRIDNGTPTTSAGGQIGTTADGEKSLLEQQADLNAKMAAENKKKEAENKKIEEENKKVAEENCTRAKLNLNNVKSSNRVNNREQLAASYEKDIERYCK